VVSGCAAGPSQPVSTPTFSDPKVEVTNSETSFVEPEQTSSWLTSRKPYLFVESTTVVTKKPKPKPVVVAPAPVVAPVVVKPKKPKKVSQKHPKPFNVTGATTSWSVGSTYDGIFADPEIVFHKGMWYAYATNTSHLKVPTLTSTDLVNWYPIKDGNGNRYDVLSSVPGWVQGSDGGAGLWAPSVAKMGGSWTLAYSAQQSIMGGERHNCIGLARSSRPGGPFTPTGDPLECAPTSQLGAIDPELYVDSKGKNWMMWKFSGVVNQRPAGIFIRQLNKRGTTWKYNSEAKEILTLQDSWEGNTIENPALVEFRGVTYLFYSANAFITDNYATGYAICKSVTGPCKRVSGNPFMSTSIVGYGGPGGASPFIYNNSLHLIYHAWEPGQTGGLRRMRIAGLWQGKDKLLRLVHNG